MQTSEGIINSVKAVVDPLTYKQVVSYRSIPILPHDVSEYREEMVQTEEDGLPCMMPTRPSMSVGGEGEVTKPKEPTVEERKADGGSVIGCLLNLLDTFTEKDIKALAEKASSLQGDIHIGFDENTYFVRSASPSQPHIVKRVTGSCDGAGYSCDKECLGFVSWKLCAHTVAMAYYNKNLREFVSWFRSKRRNRENLTALTTFSVNRGAGKKNPSYQSRQRKKSPDVMKSMVVSNSTLGDILVGTTTHQEYSAVATSDLRLNIKRNRPTKPSVDPTTSTPFQLIEIKGKVQREFKGWP